MDILTKIGTGVLIGALIVYTYNNSNSHKEYVKRDYGYAEVKTLDVVGYRHSVYNCQILGRPDESAVRWNGNELPISEYKEFLNKRFGSECQNLFYGLYTDNKKRLEDKVRR